MKKQHVQRVIEQAKDHCARSGVRLTEKRERILKVLLVSEIPLSAYDIADSYKKSFGESMPAMTVYRILDFLEKEHLSHKLSSTNKYISCSLHSKSCAHEAPKFLICGKCNSAEEISISKAVMGELEKVALKAGYSLDESQLELKGLCNKCTESKE